MLPPILCYNDTMSAQIYAVIHTRDKSEAIDNAWVAIERGANGVFFISHGELDSREIVKVSSVFQDALSENDAIGVVGVNQLGNSFQNSMANASDENLSMLWTDFLPDDNDLAVLSELRQDGLWKPQLFAGVAFKYQPQPSDLKKAAQDVAGRIDVLTTSGAGTGHAPDLEKLAVLSEGFGAKIAVASGTTPENVVSMLPYVDYFLVATGISKDFHTIDADKCRALVDAVRSAE